MLAGGPGGSKMEAHGALYAAWPSLGSQMQQGACGL